MKLQFKNITPEVFEKLKKAIGKIGVDINSDKGAIAAKGIEGSFERNPTANTLEIVIDKTPFVLPKKLIGSKIKDVVKDVGGEVI